MEEHQTECLSVEYVMCFYLPVFCSCVNHIQVMGSEAMQQIHQG